MEKNASVSDEMLMQRLREGHLSSAGVLFERYHVRLYNFFRRLSFDRDTSEDLTQTVFERLIRYRRSYVPGRSFRSWIYQIARNVRIDMVKREASGSSVLLDAESVAGTEMPASGAMIRQEDQQRLHRALARLDDEQRELLVLTRFQEMKYREVADLLQITEGAVKVRVHRAVKDLRDIYLKMEGL